LASSNTDEVIGERLLSKTEQAHVELRDIYAQKGDVINNQLSFLVMPSIYADLRMRLNSSPITRLPLSIPIAAKDL